MSFDFDVFLSHNSRDKPAVRQLGEALKQRGLRIWLDDWELVPGRPWQEALKEIIETTRAAAVLVGKDGLGPWQEPEMRACVSEFVAREVPVIPVLLPGAPGKPELPIFLKQFTWVDLREGITEEGLDRLVWGITGQKPVVATPRYPNDDVRELSQALDGAYRQKEELVTGGGDTTAIDGDILTLRRRLREGGQLKAGDFLDEGRFKLIEQIGRGGFATVWKAYDRKTTEPVAVKVLHGQFAEDRTRRERFFRGARKMAQLQHQGIVRVIEAERKEGGYRFFDMEYVAGGDLRQAVLAGRLTQAERLRIILEVGDALEFAHQRGVIHRDVKPANILLDRAGRPELTDFDLVRALDTTGGTRTAGMLGTFPYAAPEAMQNPKKAEATADVYSLGMTAIFALYGKELPIAMMRDAESIIDQLSCSSRVKKVLVKAVDWDPIRRFSSVTAPVPRVE
ncbi:MAG: protein kinase [bacterium]|nr:protein kinase [bacterium]